MEKYLVVKEAYLPIISWKSEHIIAIEVVIFCKKYEFVYNLLMKVISFANSNRI